VEKEPLLSDVSGPPPENQDNDASLNGEPSAEQGRPGTYASTKANEARPSLTDEERQAELETRKKLFEAFKRNQKQKIARSRGNGEPVLLPSRWEKFISMGRWMGRLSSVTMKRIFHCRCLNRDNHFADGLGKRDDGSEEV
jgi:hypothetical protein